jgi:hypothetical protein
VLLNKCQEEFEAGDQAMAAVDAREKAAAAKVAAGEVRRAEGRLTCRVASSCRHPSCYHCHTYFSALHAPSLECLESGG